MFCKTNLKLKLLPRAISCAWENDIFCYFILGCNILGYFILGYLILAYFIFGSKCSLSKCCKLYKMALVWSVWPDWAIFIKFLMTNMTTKVIQIFRSYTWAILTSINLSKNYRSLYLGSFWITFGYFLSYPSGHTVWWKTYCRY